MQQKKPSTSHGRINTRAQPVLALSSLASRAPPVDAPLHEGFIRTHIIKRLDHRFNQLWFHLYKATNETRQKRLGLHENLEEESLAEYAKKAMQLWAKKSSAVRTIVEEAEMGGGEELAIRSVEADVKKLDTELNKVAFLDALDLKEARDSCDNPNANKYKQRVLQDLGLDEKQGEFRIRKETNLDNGLHRTNSFNLKGIEAKLMQEMKGKVSEQDMKRYMSRLSLLRPNTLPTELLKGLNLGSRRSTFMTEVKHPPASSQNGKSRNSMSVKKVIERELSQLPGNIFNDDVIGPLVRYKSLPEEISRPQNPKSKVDRSKITLHRARQEQRAQEILTPYTKHARSLLKLSPEMVKSIDEKDKVRRQFVIKMASQIYGKGKRTVSMADIAKMQREGGNSTRKIRTKNKKKEIRLSELPTNAFRTPKKVVCGSIFSITNNAFTSIPKGSRNSAVFRSQSMIPLEKCRTVSQKRHNRAFNNLLSTCLTEQKTTDEDLAVVDRLQSDMNAKLGAIEEILCKDEIENRCDEKRYTKFITRHKCLFIYGKDGLGRFLNEQGTDVVKMSDLMKNLNPKYPFMINRLNDILVKDP